MDWSQARSSPSLGLTNYDDINKIRYHAGGDSLAAPRFDETGKRLGLSCCWVDTIEAVGTVLVTDNLHHGFRGQVRFPMVSHVLENWSEVARMQQTTKYTPTAEPLLDAFVRRLTVGPSKSSDIGFLREQYGILEGLTALYRWMTKLWVERFMPPWLERMLLLLVKAWYLRKAKATRWRSISGFICLHWLTVACFELRENILAWDRLVWRQATESRLRRALRRLWFREQMMIVGSCEAIVIFMALWMARNMRMPSLAIFGYPSIC